MITSRVSTSTSAIMTSAATHAAEPVMCWATLNRAIAGPARLAFAVAASNGAGPAIARFSVAQHITGSAAWVAALVMMALADVLTRLVIIYLRGRRLASPPASAVRTPAGIGA